MNSLKKVSVDEWLSYQILVGFAVPVSLDKLTTSSRKKKWEGCLMLPLFQQKRLLKCVKRHSEDTKDIRTNLNFNAYLKMSFIFHSLFMFTKN